MGHLEDQASPGAVGAGVAGEKPSVAKKGKKKKASSKKADKKVST